MSEGRAVYCTGGPLDGQGFTVDDWRKRLESAENLGGAALRYGQGEPPDLGSRPKAAEALASWDVTWLAWGEA